MKRKSVSNPARDQMAAYGRAEIKLANLRAGLSRTELDYGHLAVDDRIPAELRGQIEELISEAESANQENDAAQEILRQIKEGIAGDLTASLHEFYAKENDSLEDDATALALAVDRAVAAINKLT